MTPYPNEKWRPNYTKSTKDLVSMKMEEEKVRSMVANERQTDTAITRNLQAASMPNQKLGNGDLMHRRMRNPRTTSTSCRTKMKEVWHTTVQHDIWVR